MTRPFRIAVYDAKEYDRSSFAEVLREIDYGAKFELIYIPEKLSPETAAKARKSDAVCVFVNDDCSEATLVQLAKLGIQLVLARCAGFDFVDLKAAERLNISVARVPAYSPYAVAEMALALLMAVNRRIPQACQRISNNNFTLPGLEGFDLHGRTVGILGTGKIGQCFGAIATGLGCKILAFDKYVSPTFAQQKNVEYVSLETLFRRADVISLHAPLTPETRHCINRETLAMMKKGVVIINTARGGLIDSAALLDALKNGHVRGAGLDVYENEKEFFFNDFSGKGELSDRVLDALKRHPNCVITSHQAFLTTDALRNIAGTTLANAREFREGKRGKAMSNAVVAP